MPYFIHQAPKESLFCYLWKGPIMCCMICVEYQAGRLTRNEARKHLAEFMYTSTINLQHADDVDKLIDKEDEPLVKPLSQNELDDIEDTYNTYDDFDE